MACMPHNFPCSSPCCCCCGLSFISFLISLRHFLFGFALFRHRFLSLSLAWPAFYLLLSVPLVSCQLLAWPCGHSTVRIARNRERERMRTRMRKIHKKLLDFSYTFFPDIGREGGARDLRLNCFCMHMPDAWMDGRWMDVRCSHTHRHTYM